MTQIDEIQKQIQAGTLRLDLDNVHVRPEGGEDWVELEYPCWMTCEEGGLQFHFRPGRRDALTDVVKGLFNLDRDRNQGPVTITAEDCREVSARTATGVHVLLRWVSPVPDNQRSTNFVISISTGFQRLDFPATGMEQLTLPEVDAYLREEQRKLDAVSGTEREEVEAPSKPVRDWFKAIIPGVKLLIEREGTSTVTQHPFHGERTSSSRCCFIGEVLGGEFCLESEDGDLEVIYRREVGDATVEETRRVFDGLLDAVGFMHGCHPWAGSFSHSRHGKMLERWVKPRHDLQKDARLPMTKRRMHFSEDGRDLFVKAAEFFASEGEAVSYYKRSLWLMRLASGSGSASPVHLMALCSILEGVLKRFSRRYHEGSDPANLRLGDLDAWRAAVRRAELDWDEFETVYQSHQAIRNQLAHGFDPDSSNRDVGEELNAYSRISAAIYILMARRMGFRGQLERSQLESRDLVDLGAR